MPTPSPAMSRLVPVMLVTLALPHIATAQQATGSFERTLTVTGKPDLEVRSGSGSIEVRSGPAGRVEVRGRVSAGDWNVFRSGPSAQERVRRIEAAPPIEQAGNRITIGRIDDDDLKNVSVSYVVTVPAETALVSKTGSGSHVIEGVHGDITASSGSGSIRVRDAAGEVRTSSGSGSILVETVAGSVSANSGSGSIHLSGLRGSVRASTSSGTLRVQGEPTGDWRLGSSSGSVTVEFAGKPAFALDAHSSSGRIDTDYPVTVNGITGRHELRGVVNGGGPLLHVRTSSGGIHIR